MTTKQLSQRTYYAGINDRTTDLFEGLWTLPYGVSYNSYVIKGDKHTVLIDTVAEGETQRWMDNLEALDEAPSYLVVNHMEPDHSASIPALLRRFPNLKIVADRVAIGMIKGFYHIDDSEVFVEVKDGDTLDIGGDSIRFFMTPMVHWPETMMTYLENEKILFSGDAFGTFGALNGSPSDKDCDWSLYESEMWRYYASIVGKYSPFVQKALAKLSGTEIRMICSTHGPVWETRLSDVVGLYDRMSRQEAEDGVIVVFGSMYGNTESMAERFASLLTDRGIPVKRIFNAGNTDVSFILAQVWKYKGLVVAAPTYSLDVFPPMDAFVHALEIRGLKNKTVASLGNYAWAPKVAAEKMAERLGSLGLDVVGQLATPMALNPTAEQQLQQLADQFAAKYSSC